MNKMKKHFLLVFGGAFFLSVAFSQPALALSTSDGLVGYFPFSGNAEDKSGNSNHGEVNGATPTEDRFGNAGSAYSFDGVDDHIKIPLADHLQFNPNVNSFTISVWARPKELNDTDGGGVNNCVLKAAPLVDTYRYGLDNLGIYGSMAMDNLSRAGLTEPFWDTENWHLMTGTWEVSGNTIIASHYIDGQLRDQKTYNVVPGGSYPWDGLYIGATHHCTVSGLSFAKADIDEVRLYNRALTGSEISELFSGQEDVPDTEEETLFSDDFNDNSIDSTKWTIAGTRVVEQSSVMNVNQDATDAGGILWSKWIPVNSMQLVTVSRRTIQHKANNYFNGLFRMIFDSNGDGIADISFGVDHVNHGWHSSDGLTIERYGIFLALNGWSTDRDTKTSSQLPNIWDTWFTEELAYNPVSGILSYSINGVSQTTLDVGMLSSSANCKMQLYVQAWGWWTGHYDHFDDISVVQSNQLINQPPVLSEVTSVPSSTENQTPSYTFNSTQVGEIIYGGDCNSSTTVAVAGDNAIAFNSLSEGLHNNCTITVINDAGKNSNVLVVSSFTVVVPSKDFTFVHMTDVHLGENLTALAKQWGKDWFEEWSYSRFIDALYQIEKRNPKPESVLISGDLVEYVGDKGMGNEKHPEGWKWLKDFKSFVDGYEKRTGIKIYYVPGNHDRYERPAGEIPPLADILAGNDKLFQYGEVIQSVPDYATNLFDKYATNYDYNGGYDPFNYYFSNKDKSINFIGLDTGVDNGGIGFDFDNNKILDFLPKSAGLTEQHADKLNEYLPFGNKIIFMHSPIFNEGLDGNVPDGSISKYRDEFINYCKNSNVDLVLSGHTHKNRIYDKAGNGVINATSLTFNDEYKPYYIQTQSATKGDNRGFRIIDVVDGKAKKTNVVELKEDNNFITPQLVFEEKQDNNSSIELSQENSNNKISARGIITGDFKFPYYYAEGSKKLFLEDYGDTNIEINIKNSSSSNFEIAKYWKDPQSNEEENYTPAGLRILNSEFCEFESETKCQGGTIFKEVYPNSKVNYRIMGLETHESSENKVKINWEDKRVDFIINNNDDTALIRFGHMGRAKMNSPAELRVIDSSGKITGLKVGKIIEEIPNSYYDPIHEQVIFFTDSDEDFQNLRYEATGMVEGEYKLTLESGHEDAFDQKVEITEMPIAKSTVHQFSVDWNQLNDKGGVEMKIDQNGDGNFEKEFNAGSVITKDDAAPQTTITLSGVAGVDNWYRSDTQVILSAQDNEGGIGVEKTEYSLDNGDNWNKYENPIAIPNEGINKISYRSVDWFSNQEEIKTAEIKIDKTAPEAVVSPSLNEVGIEVDGTDNLSEAAVEQKSATEYVISDEAGNTAKLQFEGEKIRKGKNYNRDEQIKKWYKNNGFWKKFFSRFRFGKETNSEVGAKLKTVQYNDEPAIQLPNNRLHFVWKTSKKELITLLEQQLEVLGSFKIIGNYNEKKDETNILIHEKGKPKRETFDGLKILNMKTVKGVLQYDY